MRLKSVVSAIALASLAGTSPVEAKMARKKPAARVVPKKSFDEVLDSMGIDPSRGTDFDLCYPANSDEYEALGKHGVVRIDAQSILSSELPLTRAYLTVKGLNFPLRMLVTLDKVKDDQANKRGVQYWRQVSFYLVPLNLLKGKGGADLSVDFNGPRRGFEAGSIGSQGPAFVRLDEYDTPSEPDMKALATLLAREYPDDFPSPPNPS